MYIQHVYHMKGDTSLSCRNHQTYVQETKDKTEHTTRKGPTPIFITKSTKMWLLLKYPDIPVNTYIVYSITKLYSINLDSWFSMLWLWNVSNKQAAGIFPRFWECNCENVILYDWVVDWKRRRFNEFVVYLFYIEQMFGKMDENIMLFVYYNSYLKNKKECLMIYI